MKPTSPLPQRLLALIKRPWVWAAIVILVGAGYGFLAGRGTSTEAAPAGKRGFGGPTPVVAATAKKGDMPVFLRGLGSVVPQSNVTVRSRVDGQLMKLHFKEGETVKAGQLLAEIDPRPFQVQLAQAEGVFARDEALLKNARVDLERYKTLLAQDSIPRQQLDTQEALVRQLEATLKSDQSQVDNARLQLTYARVSAPAQGRLGLKQVDPGNIIRAGDANGLVLITQLQPITVVFSLPEDSLPGLMKRLFAGEKLPVDAWDREQKTRLAAGHLVTVDNLIDPATGTVKLKARFTNEDFALFPNQFVNARLLLETKKEAVLIPASAIQRGQQNSTFVYVIKEDKTVTVRPVKLGPSEGETVSLASGLAPGEQVVADGADKLREGAKVEIQTPGAAKTPGEAKPGKGEGKKKRGGE